ncbi:hypothetical protein LCGC14_1466020, partial [marine sediment metagenome]
RTAEAQACKTALAQQECMPSVQTVLAQAGTALTDFTLHDSGHAFRVAERMIEIIPAKVLPRMSAFELSLLLLSAYCHDIGMSPERRKVTSHYEYLLTGAPGDLDEAALGMFQKWLDDEGTDIVPPIAGGSATVEAIRLAQEVVTHYSRSRHNDWSEDWMRTNLSGHGLGNYTNWLDDLVLICRSHHFGYQALCGDEFDPKLVPATNKLVHMRYLACVLRLADVLEFDPERTPDVILRHRDVRPRSLVYWWKDHFVAPAKEGDGYVVHAEPPNAKIHRAIEISLDEVDQEMSLCWRISTEKHFEKASGFRKDLPHTWDVLPRVHRNIRPKGDVYEYVNGAFRPNTQKLLELLSGVQLYGDSLVALRELIQNAFDAVTEQIAYQVLEAKDRGTKVDVTALREMSLVDVQLEKKGADHWLVCTDDGVGMTKEIITQHLLVSGNPRRHQVLALERRCRAAEFAFNRAGQFGIGVLSYFMLADRVEIRTMRSDRPGDADPTGWYFESEGVGSFGELRKERGLTHGTEVRLRLRPDTIGDPKAWYDKVATYLRKGLARVPCSFRFHSDSLESQPVALSPGWTLNEDDLRDWLQDGLAYQVNPAWRSQGEYPEELLPSAKRREREERRERLAAAAEELARTSQWIHEEGVLPNDIGTYRIHLPYFSLCDGESLGFLWVQRRDGLKHIQTIDKGCLFYPRDRVRMSWLGNCVNKLEAKDRVLGRGFDRSPGRRPHSAFAEVDFHSADAGRINVDRNRLVLAGPGVDAVNWLEDRALNMRAQFTMDRPDSVYSYLNSILSRTVAGTQEPHWLQFGDHKAIWDKVSFPMVTSQAFKYRPFPHGQMVRLDEQEVQVLPSVPGVDGAEHYTGYSWATGPIPPDRVVCLRSPMGPACPVWTKMPALGEQDNPNFLKAAFPPKWSQLCGVKLYEYSAGLVVWNPANPLIRTLLDRGFQWPEGTHTGRADPLAIKDQLLDDRDRAAAWILETALSGERDIWDALPERDAAFLPALWKCGLDYDTIHANEIPIVVWVQDFTHSRLEILSPEDWRTIGERDKSIQDYMPTPDPAWCLTVDDPD